MFFVAGNKYDIKCTVKPGAMTRTLHIPILFEFLPEINEETIAFYIGRTLVSC